MPERIWISIDAVVNSQKGIIQPQIIIPAEILEQGKINQADMPSDLSLPITMSATHQRILFKIISIDVFLKVLFLVYVIRLPLTICFTICFIFYPFQLR